MKEDKIREIVKDEISQSLRNLSITINIGKEICLSGIVQKIRQAIENGDLDIEDVLKRRLDG